MSLDEVVSEASRTIDAGDWSYFLMLEANMQLIRWAMVKGLIYGLSIAVLLVALAGRF